MKYIKFGYGRCTDHATKDIRSKSISRSKAIKLIKKMDHVVPSDLKRWLVCSWRKNFLMWSILLEIQKVTKGYWYKNCIWGKEHKFEKVRLNKISKKIFYRKIILRKTNN